MYDTPSLRHTGRPSLDLTRLESRILYSATPLGDLAHVDSSANALPAHAAAHDDLSDDLSTDLSGTDLLAASDNHAPVANVSLAVVMMQEDHSFRWMMPSFLFTDVDPGTHLEWSLRLADGNELPTWLSFDSANHILEATPDNDHVGGLAIELTATDDLGATAIIPVSLHVTNVDDLPEFVLPTELQGHTDQILQLGTHEDNTIQIQDVDGETTGDPYLLKFSIDHGELSWNQSPQLPLLVDHTSPNEIAFAANSLEQVQFVLDHLEIHPPADYTGSASLSMTISQVLSAPTPSDPAPEVKWSVSDTVPVQFTPPPPEPTFDPTHDPQAHGWLTHDLHPDSVPDISDLPSAESSLDGQTRWDAEHEMSRTLSWSDDRSAHGEDVARNVAASSPTHGSLWLPGVGDDASVTHPWGTDVSAHGLAEAQRFDANAVAAIEADELMQRSPWFRQLAQWSSRLNVAAPWGRLAAQYLEELDENRAEWAHLIAVSPWTLPAAVVAASSLSAGYLSWATRNGSLFVGALAVVPAWNCIDPLPVLERARRAPQDEETLASLLCPAAHADRREG